MNPRPQAVISEQGRRARAVFETALQRRPSERMAFIDGACFGDEALRAQVIFLLDTAGDSFRSSAAPSVPLMPAPPPPVVVPQAAVPPAPAPIAAPAVVPATQALAATPAEADFEKTRVAPAAPAPAIPAPVVEDFERTRVALAPAAQPKPADLEPVRVAPAPATTAPVTMAQTMPLATPAPAHFDPNAPMEGRRIGPYQLLYSLGQGGMGSVYAASRADQEYRKIVAIKLVTAGLHNEAMLRRFRNERQVLASLDHPFISRLIDGGTTEDGLPYLVMEFVEGLPIDKYCQSHKLSFRARLALFGKVCDAVQYAHEHLVIHRDIKPGNIMVTANGEPKLLDFGIARLMTAESSAEEMELSKGETQPMTLRYASPEQIKGESISTASDIYALGTLLYELLAGRHPFQKSLGGRVEIENAILTEAPEKPSCVLATEKFEGKLADKLPPEPLPRLGRLLSGDVDCIVLQTIAKQPAARYSSVQSLAEDIHNYLAGLPVAVRNADVRYRVGKFIKRHLALVAASFLLIATMVTGTLVSRMESKKAISRFNDVRKLAHFVLFDFDDAMQLGETPARQVLVTQALGYLRSLAKDSHNDLPLQKEIIDGYIKVGDLQGNPLVKNLNQPKAARESYTAALQVVKDARTKNPNDPELLTSAAELNRKLASLLAGVDPKAALAAYSEAEKALEPLVATTPKARRTLMKVLQGIAFANMQLGANRAALTAYSRSGQIAKELYTGSLAAGKSDLDARQAMALAEEGTGELLAGENKLKEGLEHLRSALGLQEEMAANSTDGSRQRDIARTLNAMASAYTASNEKEQAIEACRRAAKIWENLAANDPRNQEYRRGLPDSLGSLVDALLAANRLDEARPVTEREIRLLRPIVDESSPYLETYQLVWTMETSPFRDLQDWPLVLSLSEKLVKMTDAKDPNTLDLLARASFGSGDHAQAIKTEQKALALLPPNSVSALRTELQENLTKFSAGPDQKKSR